MFKVTIIKLKDIVKIGIILILIYVFSIFILKNMIHFIVNYKNKNSDKFLLLGINSGSDIIKYFSTNDKDAIEKTNENSIIGMQKILETGSPFFDSKNLGEVIGQEGEIIENKDKNFESIEENEKNDIPANIECKVVTKDPIPEIFNFEINGVKIKNETELDLSNINLNDESLDINKENIIIFHTHTCESYTQSDKYTYNSSGNYRTTDLNYSVAEVGTELKNYLDNFGFNVNHDKTYHDYPAYNGSYGRSLLTVSSLLNTFPADIIIDIHRDAIGSNENYAPLVQIGNDLCAQIMFVMGSNGSGLEHPNWQSNFKFAVKVQKKANEMYPGLFKPIIVRNSRYNQQLGKAACIIEVGATGNTLDQTLLSMKYLANVMNEVLK